MHTPSPLLSCGDDAGRQDHCRGSDLAHLRRALAHGGLVDVLRGNPLVAMGMAIGTLAVILTLLPIVISADRGRILRTFRRSWSLLLYFACIGFG